MVDPGATLLQGLITGSCPSILRIIGKPALRGLVLATLAAEGATIVGLLAHGPREGHQG